ncbi:MAG: DNA alkylation repair protein [Candidatus Nanosyncoccus sp.]
MILEDLLENRDEKYADFNARLIPNIERSRILGVRMPILRKIVKSKYRELEENGFLKKLPHRYQEENLIHGIMISEIRNLKLCIRELDRFLPFVDNWAVCDVLSPNVLKNNREETLRKVDLWLKSGYVYTVRFAIGVLMQYFLDKEFNDEYLEKIVRIENDDYYVKMMQAWYFATALAKQWENAIVYLEQKKLKIWVHNKTIQKAIESRRISAENKKYLKALKIKD